jgi:molybdate transport system permease protein
VVIGLVLLKLFGRRGLLGHWLYSHFAFDVAFTWRAVALALAVMSFPLLVRVVRSAIREV